MAQLIRTHAALLFTGIVTFVLMGAGQALYGPALPAFARDFGLSLAQVGWLVSALWIGSATGVALMFWRGAQVTPRHALAVMAAGSGVIAAGLGFWGAMAGSVIFGTGYGISAVVFNPRVLRAFGARGASMVSLLNAMFALGAIAMPLVFVAVGANPQLCFAMIAALCVVTWLFAGSANGEGQPEAVAGEAYRFRPLILCFAIVCIGVEASLIGLGPTALIRAGAAEDVAAQALSGFFVAFLVARMALVFVAHRFRSFDLLVGALGLAGAASVAAVLLPPVPFFVGMGAAAGLFFPNCFVTASRLMGSDPRVTPTIIAAGLVGGIGSPVLLAEVLGGMGERGFFVLIGAACLTATLAGLALRRRMG